MSFFMWHIKTTHAVLRFVATHIQNVCVLSVIRGISILSHDLNTHNDRVSQKHVCILGYSSMHTFLGVVGTSEHNGLT